MSMVKWIYCPNCKRKTKIKVLYDTVLQNFLLFCPWCKKQFLINLEHYKVKLVHEIDI